MEEFEINVKTLRYVFNPIRGVIAPLSLEEVKTNFTTNLITQAGNENMITYKLRDQTYIPHYALDISTSKYKFREDNYTNCIVEDIEYPKLEGMSRTGTSSNNINVILDYMFNYWAVNSHNNLIKIPFVKDGVARHIFIAPGMLMDQNGKILCSIVYKKELITKINLIEGFDKFRDLFSLYSANTRKSLGVGLDDFLNENGLVLVNKEFSQKPEYARFYKAILAIFVNGIRYNLDLVNTDSIEKHICNLPIDTTIDLKFSNMKEKDNFCREVLKKSLLT